MKNTLSTRQVEIMRLICRGMVAKEIAEAKAISVRTVESHLQEAKRRLLARNIVQAAVLFMQREEVQRRG